MCHLFAPLSSPAGLRVQSRQNQITVVTGVCWQAVKEVEGATEKRLPFLDSGGLFVWSLKYSFTRALG
jgi:hypothetical protein